MLLIHLRRVGQFVARHHYLTLHRDKRYARGIGGIWQHFAAHRRATLRHFGRVGGEIDEFEFQLRSLTQQILELLGVLQTRHLHNDAIVALSHDARLARAQFVDALADDFGGDFHRAVDRSSDACIGRAEDDRAAVYNRHVEIALPGHPCALRQRTDALHGGVDLCRIADHEGQFAVAPRNVANRDARIAPAQFGADLIFHVGQTRLGHVIGACLQQQMAAARQIEAKIDAHLHGLWPLIGNAFGQEAGDRAQNADTQRQQNERYLPTRKGQHRVSRSPVLQSRGRSRQTMLP